MLTHANMVQPARTLPQGRGRAPRRRVAGVPADGVGRRLALHAGAEPHGRLRGQLPGEPRDGPARPARARAHHGAGPAAHLGEHADRRAGAGRRRAAAQALGVRALPRRRRAGGDPPVGRQGGAAGPAAARVLGEFFVYGPVRDQLGLLRASWAYTGGAPLGPDTFRFFRSIGVNLKQVYGSTESTGLVSLQPDAEANPTTAGRPCPGIEVQDRRARRGAGQERRASSRATSRTTRPPAR